MARGKDLMGWLATGVIGGAVVGALATGVGFLGTTLIGSATAGIVTGGIFAAGVSYLGFLLCSAAPWETQSKGSFRVLGLSYLAAGAVVACAMTGYVPSFIKDKSAGKSFNQAQKNKRDITCDGKTYIIKSKDFKLVDTLR